MAALLVAAGAIMASPATVSDPWPSPSPGSGMIAGDARAIVDALERLAPRASRPTQIAAVHAVGDRLAARHGATGSTRAAVASTSEEIDLALFAVLPPLLDGPDIEALKRDLAIQRITLLVGDNHEPSAASSHASQLLDHLSRTDRPTLQQLLDGGLSDDAIAVLAAKLARAALASDRAEDPAQAAVAVLRAFRVRNRAGGMLPHVSAVSIEGTIEAAGEQRDFVLHKLRPACFRLDYQAGGTVHQILGSDGRDAWQWNAAHGVEPLPRELHQALASLVRFDNPLLAPPGAIGGAKITRLPDGTRAGRPVHRLQVEPTADEAGYVAEIDCETLLEIARVQGDLVLLLEDHRDVAGTTLPFLQREDGGRGQAVRFTRVTTDAGLFPAFFAPPASTVSR